MGFQIPRAYAHDRQLVQLLSGQQENRRHDRKKQAHSDHGLQRRARGIKSCVERGECLRRKLNIPSGTRHELCYAVHAEQNAIIQAAKLGVSIEGATLYCTHQPCVLCAKMIVNAGITRVVYSSGYPDEFSMEILKEGRVTVEKLPWPPEEDDHGPA